jgi:colanic acid/amylovoran biosynthesis glycosyltransferase
MIDLKKLPILYLAPEIPALSATFVYNEIGKLRDLGYQVTVASVHAPIAEVDQETKQKVGEVFVVYQSSFALNLLALLTVLVTRPLHFGRAFGWLLNDIVSLGVFNRNALGVVFRFVAAAKLARYIIQNNIAHSHVHFAHVPTDIGMYAACMSGTTFSVTSHANDIFQRGWLLKQKIKRSQFFVTISEFNKAYLSKLAPQLKNKIQVIYCGVDTSQFTFQAPQNNDVFTFGFLARLVEKKGLEYLIKACKKLKDQHHNFKVEIVGGGPLSEVLKALTHELGLQNQITFLGQMPNKQVSDWLKTLNAFVLPAVKDSNGDMDGIPVSLMEAMASGIPVISTDLSGIKELVIDKQTGLLSLPGNEQDLADKMVELMAIKQTELYTLTKQAEAHVKQYFNQLANAEKIGKLIVNNEAR